MELSEYAKMARLQDHHWWFRAKRKLVRAVLGRCNPPLREGNFLEVGCGTGAMSPVFRDGNLSVGLDLHAAALAHAGDTNPVAGDVLAQPFAPSSFDVVGCFDLLYHRNVPRVHEALAEIARVTRPGGWLVITDSACPALYGTHDLAHHGARRFTRDELRAQVELAGFKVEHASHLHTLVFPLVWLSRVGSRVARRGLRRPEPPVGQSQLSAVPGPINALLAAYYSLETALAARFSLPFGVTVVVLARRR